MTCTLCGSDDHNAPDCPWLKKQRNRVQVMRDRIKPYGRLADILITAGLAVFVVLVVMLV